MEGSKFTSQTNDVLEAFKRLRYPAVFYPEVPEGRFACFVFLKSDEAYKNLRVRARSETVRLLAPTRH